MTRRTSRRLASAVAGIATVAATVLVAPGAGASTSSLSFTSSQVGNGREGDTAQAGEKDGGGEPSMLAGPEGNLYVSYPCSSGMCFVRSFDDGRSWQPGGLADDQSGDTALAADASGALYQANLNGFTLDQDMLQASVFKSTDEGATWPQSGAGPVLDSNATNQPLLVDRQWIDAYIPDGKTTDDAQVYLTYHDFGPSQVWVATSTDGGKTFGTPVTVLTDPQAQAATFCNSIPGGLKVAKDGPHTGRVYVAWLAGGAGANEATGCNITQMDTFSQVWVAWSDDGGQTWTDHLVFDGGFGHDASALFADLTLDNQGNPYLAFGDNLDGEWDMYVEASFDGGETFNGADDGTGAPYQVNADSGTHFFPAIVAGDPGKVNVAYIATPTKIETLPYGKPSPGGGAGATWNLYVAQSLDLTSGDPHWSITTASPEPIHVGDVCTLGIFCLSPLGSNRDLLDFIDASLDPGGRVHVAYTADTDSFNGIFVANQRGGHRVVTPPRTPHGLG